MEPRPPHTRTIAVRAMAEPRVRFWWLATVAMSFIVGYVVVGNLVKWRRENRLLSEGLRVQATVLKTSTLSTPGQKVPGEEPLTIRYSHLGREYTTRGILSGRSEHVVIGDDVPIRVDRDRPELWTGRTAPTPLWESFIGSILLLPLGLLTALICWWRRRQLLRLWHTGQRVQAIIHEVRNVPIAPSARAIRCAPVDSTSRRLFTVYLSATAHEPRTGDRISVTGDITKGQAVADEWFVRPNDGMKS